MVARSYIPSHIGKNPWQRACLKANGFERFLGVLKSSAPDVGLAPSASWRAFPLQPPCTLGPLPHTSPGRPLPCTAKRVRGVGGKREGEGGKGRAVASWKGPPGRKGPSEGREGLWLYGRELRSAVSCRFLRKSVVSCGFLGENLHLLNAVIPRKSCKNQRKSAKNCEFGSVCPFEFVPFNSP